MLESIKSAVFFPNLIYLSVHILDKKEWVQYSNKREKNINRGKRCLYCMYIGPEYVLFTVLLLTVNPLFIWHILKDQITKCLKFRVWGKSRYYLVGRGGKPYSWGEVWQGVLKGWRTLFYISFSSPASNKQIFFCLKLHQLEHHYWKLHL